MVSLQLLNYYFDEIKQRCCLFSTDIYFSASLQDSLILVNIFGHFLQLKQLSCEHFPKMLSEQ